MDTSKVIEALKAGLASAEALAPIAKQLGVPAFIADAASYANGLIAVGENVKARADEGKVVLANQDRAEVDGIIRRLAALNDGLHKAIDAS